MNEASMRWRGRAEALAGKVEWGPVGTWVLGFGFVAYLGLEGGGYDPLVHDRAGIAVWWLLLVAVAVGAMPRRRLGRLSWIALGLLAAFVLWTGLSLVWTESTGRTFADLARVTGYLGVFALAVFSRGRDEGRGLLCGVAAGVALVSTVALLSRLHPAWFPDANQTAQFLSGNEERLSYPIHYWNGLAALVAIGMPSLLWAATGARRIAWRALAAAALPVLGLTAFLTLSRGGIGSGAIALVVFLVFAADRLPKVATLVVAAAGTAALCLAVAARDSLHDGLLDATAEAQGDEILAMTLLVCLAVAAAQIGISAALSEERRPRWTRVPRRPTAIAAGVAALALLVGVAALDAPGRAADAWDEFKSSDSPGGGSSRLTSAAGQNRYTYWASAVDQNATEPLTGTGSGTFEYWWTRNRDSAETVRDTHSLYMQTLGELGIVGLALLVAFFLVVLGAGAWAATRTDGAGRSLLAAALAGCIAFCVAAAVDWMWQIPVLAVAMLLLAAVLVVPGSNRDEAGEPGTRLPGRLAFGSLAIVAIVAIAIPLTAESQLRDSETEAREGNLATALIAARGAQNAEPGAAAPRLQQALLLEELGDLEAASDAAGEAVERERTNWRNWFVLSRIEAERGRPEAAIRAYRRARSLNPKSPLFDR